MRSTRPDAAPPDAPSRHRAARRPSPRAALAALLSDPDLARLDGITPAFDPLEVLAWSRREHPHTRFLAWLLDPHDPRPGGGHGLGTAFLRRFVARALGAVEALPGVHLDALPRDVADPGEIPAAGVRVVREQPVGDGVRVTARAPDIRVTWTDRAGAAWLLVVENKVDAAEGEGQVRDYLAWARATHPGARRLLVYVTPDGRAPDSRLDGEVVVPLAWPDVAEAGVEALGDAGGGRDPAARAFVAAVLESLRARFGGRADVRALVEALHERHPRACALAASPAVESSLVEPLRARFPHAAFHLRSVQPRAFPWSRAWTERVARAFALVAGPAAPALVPAAPHAECPDVASWSLAGVSDRLALYVLCTHGAPLGGARPKVWVALRAPGGTARDAFEAREQLAAVEALPEPTRRWLLGAAPVYETPSPGGGWRWLCAGAPLALPRGYSHDDDARRVAEAVHALVGPHLAALRAFSADPEQRLFSCDLDPDHGLPTDDRDREALAREAAPDAERVLLATWQPTGHMFELRREAEVGVALGAAFGGSRSLAYGYSHAPCEAPSVVVVGAEVLRGGRAPSLDAVHEAAARGATVVLLGGRWDPGVAREGLGALAEPVTFTTAWEEWPGGAELAPGDDDARGTFAALAARDARLVGGAACARVDARARVALSLVAKGAGRAGERFPLVAAWRAGAARVVLWAGGAYGPWGRALRARPETFGRWWRAVVAFARAEVD